MNILELESAISLLKAKGDGVTPPPLGLFPPRVPASLPVHRSLLGLAPRDGSHGDKRDKQRRPIGDGLVRRQQDGGYGGVPSKAHHLSA